MYGGSAGVIYRWVIPSTAVKYIKVKMISYSVSLVFGLGRLVGQLHFKDVVPRVGSSNLSSAKDRR